MGDDELPECHISRSALDPLGRLQANANTTNTLSEIRDRRHNRSRLTSCLRGGHEEVAGNFITHSKVQIVKLSALGSVFADESFESFTHTQKGVAKGKLQPIDFFYFR